MPLNTYLNPAERNVTTVDSPGAQALGDEDMSVSDWGLHSAPPGGGCHAGVCGGGLCMCVSMESLFFPLVLL